DHLIVARFEGGESSRGFQIAGFDVSVKVAEELHERVRVAFGVATGISGVTLGWRAQECRIFREFLVGAVSPANPQRTRLFGIPGERAFGAVDFIPQASASPGADLRHGHNTT